MNGDKSLSLGPPSSAASSADPRVNIVRQRPIQAPGPGGFLSARPLMLDPLPFLEKMFRNYGDVVRMRILNLRVYAVAHPEGIKHVLQDNHRNYRKSFDYKILARLLGQGLVTSEGSLWLKQRRLMQPTFHRQKITGFGALMADCTLQMLERWREGRSGAKYSMSRRR